MAKIEEDANAIIDDHSSELKCFIAKEGMIVEI
jgi:hypothetical protein